MPCAAVYRCTSPHLQRETPHKTFVLTKTDSAPSQQKIQTLAAASRTTLVSLLYLLLFLYAVVAPPLLRTAFW
jgi:hypothetical protein